MATLTEHINKPSEDQRSTKTGSRTAFLCMRKQSVIVNIVNIFQIPHENGHKCYISEWMAYALSSITTTTTNLLFHQIENNDEREQILLSCAVQISSKDTNRNLCLLEWVIRYELPLTPQAFPGYDVMHLCGKQCSEVWVASSHSACPRNQTHCWDESAWTEIRRSHSAYMRPHTSL